MIYIKWYVVFIRFFQRFNVVSLDFIYFTTNKTNFFLNKMNWRRKSVVQFMATSA